MNQTRADQSLEIRYCADGIVCAVYADGVPVRVPTQDDMDTLPIGPVVSAEDIAEMDE